MMPGARVQAAIEVLDRILAGDAAEKALTVWARGSRFAGSKDRAAVRDHVFDALRMLRSGSWAGGIYGMPVEYDGRSVLAGVLSLQGADLGVLFSGQGHAPAPLDPLPVAPDAAPDAVNLDCPDWLLPLLRRDLGGDADVVLQALRTRAPVFLRVNAARISTSDLIARLTSEGVAVVPDDTAPTAVRLDGTPRGLTNLPSFQEGLWELQDAGSQSLIARLPSTKGMRVLDLCAGGGGKALALAARGDVTVLAHDADPARMSDIPVRAERAGVNIKRLSAPEDDAPFDAVIADVPCSGSGSWRRAPDAKWRLTPERLDELTALQREILRRAIAMVRPGGWVAYMTCSILARENAELVDAVLADTGGLELGDRWSCLPQEGRGDGFHLSVINRRV
ncbi:16S rRNA (cytosine967-C5)-methyltransferase [Jannaschia faecimaris]|uniref:16S rRNA (Cytosine967-C5)-methyltransferase n=1 Tax=Jannaschia faecimaris TaxID=1244108 RepID=A0A1H3NSY6_9RHOB|nr:RsmB/NOP family class I SAM-dependent RNA methyltransferase [Jannaschia faecimaris]SDY91908.1 16S rRNA (cytosine967-C5)-methyltransferase [Jannaschia faecimaris]